MLRKPKSPFSSPTSSLLRLLAFTVVVLSPSNICNEFSSLQEKLATITSNS
eukprot:m.41431 g.41431  ORF g.41431 m.41431 type:complete len:51 (+) comp10498_c0_seq2:558-710(+)